MSITVDCPSCQTPLEAPDNAAGKVVKCPNCATRVRVPAQTQDEDESGGAGAYDDSEPAPPAVASTARRGGILVSSGGICEPYQTLGLVVGFASKSEGCGGKIAIEDTYRAALQRLTESAKAKGGNALIFVNFQNRVASQAGCGQAQQVFEVFAWGTAIRV